jgi:hypothetical protein
VIIPLASIRKYKKVIKINLTTALNSEILRSLGQWFPNRCLGFCHSGVTSQDFIKFWGEIFAFVLLEMIGNSQGFETF